MLWFICTVTNIFLTATIKILKKSINLEKLKCNDKNLTKHVRSLLKFDGEGRCVNAFYILSEPNTLRLAYESIKSKPGNMVEGSDKSTLDGIYLK